MNSDDHARLVETGLLVTGGDRYGLHDLLRLCTRGRLEAEESAQESDGSQ